MRESIQSDPGGGGRERIQIDTGRGEDSQSHRDEIIHGDTEGGGEGDSDTGGRGTVTQGERGDIHSDTLGRGFTVTQGEGVQ